jgi:hypothetical protein
MAQFLTVRDGSKLVPASAVDLEELEKVRRGQPVLTTVTFRRSLKHHRWLRKFVAVVADGLDIAPGLLWANLKYKGGFIALVLPGGGVVLESAAHDAMDEIRFNEMRISFVEQIFRDWLPGVKRKDVYQQVTELTGEACPWID